MSNENYKLLMKHKPEIFNMVYDIYRGAPPTPLFGFATKEEEEEHNKKLNEYLELHKPKITKQLSELGFNVEGLWK